MKEKVQEGKRFSLVAYVFGTVYYRIICLQIRVKLLLASPIFRIENLSIQMFFSPDEEISQGEGS